MIDQLIDPLGHILALPLKRDLVIVYGYQLELADFIARPNTQVLRARFLAHNRRRAVRKVHHAVEHRHGRHGFGFRRGCHFNND